MDIFAATVPVDETEPAFADELVEPGPHRQVQIGYMGENEHRGMMQRESSLEQWPGSHSAARALRAAD
jgi:hypothetical protein